MKSVRFLMTRRQLVVCICCVLATAGLGTGSYTAGAADVDTAVVRLLKSRCVRCHGPNKAEAGLDLSSPAGLAKGSENGSVVAAGDPDASVIWQRVSADEMPPETPLTADEKQLLKAWIAAGAVGLESAKLGHWAFRSLDTDSSPTVRNAERIRTEIDRHIQSRLEAEGLSLGPDADPHTLIRRVAFDVTGLPPSPEEVERFVSDPAADAYEKMVERYLSSARFGERWGKHWLDAAGYADSNGYFSADTNRPHAYRYRDYVVRSLNANKPFDRFIREQLAGDELAGFQAGQPTTPEAIELLTATHFLRNGQDGTDIGVKEPEAFEVDRRAALEAAVQVTASSLLGLTLHCARCHDHKFEPITQDEYYAFQAILFPAFNPQNWVNPEDRVVYAYLPGEKESWEANDKRIAAELEQIRQDYTSFLTENREPSELLLAESFNDDSWRGRWSNTAPGDDAPGGSVSLDAESANAANVTDSALRIISGPADAWLSTTMKVDWTPERPGDWVQATFQLVDNKVGGGPAMRIGYTIAAHDFDDNGAVAGGNLLVDGNPSTATSLYSDYPGTDQMVAGQIGHEGYVPGRNYGVRVTRTENNKFRLDHMVDGLPDGQSLEMNEADLPDGGFAFYYCASRSYVVDDVRIERNVRDDGANEEIAAVREKLAAKKKEYEERRKELEGQRSPNPGRPIAWVTDTSAEPPVVPFLTRGLYHERGPNVEPTALAVLTDAGHEYRPRPDATQAATTGRRLGFAEWLLQPEGKAAALLARVHVNRVWREYFGRGIAETTDNLGQSGPPPTHPELIDELARGFIQSGWDQKALHRRIVLSTVYRQSSAARPEGLAADPGDRLLWRRPVRRLPAEMIRDAMLAASGWLDNTPFGPYVPTEQTPVGEVVVDPQNDGAFRRTVYLQQRRSQTVSMLKVFDAPAIATICTARPSSTVPLQSLALLNSEFSVSTGEALAARLLADTDGTDPSLVRRAWQIAVARPPTADEERLSIDFLAGQRKQYEGEEAAKWALSDFCQMLLASNAFLYLE